eukprot:gnl/MRDRNA2_/MRDRNA2_23921_c0_seq1.p1 gnl/MRDRNA2_/MRDRNA2_23921_c0~~gnl/MRDRNA2_/MRDRNA2_23921_c0_seq1.p1  ORF type:complete len:154 (-),score=20.23 gnl/MRDRNA2_/MRDRNA2_23921_c0_seq1:280-741(-)
MCTRDERTVFVGGLSLDIDAYALKQEFKECGDLNSLRLVKDKHGRFKGCVFIEYNSRESALAALKHNGKSREGRTMRVSLVSRQTGARAAGRDVVQETHDGFSESKLNSDGKLISSHRKALTCQMKDATTMQMLLSTFNMHRIHCDHIHLSTC